MVKGLGKDLNNWMRLYTEKTSLGDSRKCEKSKWFPIVRWCFVGI